LRRLQLQRARHRADDRGAGEGRIRLGAARELSGRFRVRAGKLHLCLRRDNRLFFSKARRFRGHRGLCFRQAGSLALSDQSRVAFRLRACSLGGDRRGTFGRETRGFGRNRRLALGEN
jgi:hypothetical protein